MHRRLISKKDFANWAKELGFFRSFGFEGDDFYIFFDYLEEIELMSPLKVAKKSSEFGNQMAVEEGSLFFEKPTDEYLNTVDHYYHPFQFFQFILYYNYYKTKSIQKSLFYYYQKKRKTELYIKDEETKIKQKKKIEKEQNKWMKESIRERFKVYNRNVGKSKNMGDKKKKEQRKKNKKSLKRALKKKKENVSTGLRGLRGLTWLRPALFKTWLKLDSLLFYGEYIITPNFIDISHSAVNCLPHDTKKEENTIKEFHKWREEKLKTKEHILNDEEIEYLKRYIFEIDRIFTGSSKNLMNGLDKWTDLFDLIPTDKLANFQGITNVCLNILSIKRFLIRITWALSNYNLIAWPKDQRIKQPYFFISGSEEIISYRSSVLADFNLFITTPFILYVEGRAEWEILNEYVNKKFRFRFKVENMVGVDNLPYFKQICDAVKGRIFYFFIDFHNLDEFLSKKDKYKENCSFFFPDFITENFTVEEFKRAFNLWVATIKLNFEEKQKEELYEKLEQEKRISAAIIQEYESENQIQRRTTNGFEKVLINYLKQHFSEDLYELYPQRIKLDHNNRLVNPEDFGALIKTELTSRFKKLIAYSIKRDPERRGQKFPFENKLEPFYKKINNYIYRNINTQFTLNKSD
ncbi:hypothetical protein LCGC14_0991450 [marine sediment metagenome]|uniref:DUF4435 domain-containing protein n=1 Tax=marine sediment metagenome TaxID=412755 RepID=A0A0F9QP47_9ZZZZ